MPKIATIIVNYRAAHLVERHMPQLLKELADFPGSRVIVVDNASPGDDAAVLRELAGRHDDVVFIEAERNGGFAYGNNRGLEAAGDADAYFFLNPDAVPEDGALLRLWTTLAEEEGVGVVGPRFRNADGEERSSAFTRFSPLREFVTRGGFPPMPFAAGRTVLSLGQGPVEADWIPGAAMLVSQDAVRDVGGMDEGYFLYFEETDWLEAIRRAGFRVLCDPRAVVRHIEGQSTNVVGASSGAGRMPDYWYESWLRFWGKNRSRPTALLAAGAFVAGVGTARLRHFVKGRKSQGGPEVQRFLSKCLVPLLKGYKP